MVPAQLLTFTGRVVLHIYIKLKVYGVTLKGGIVNATTTKPQTAVSAIPAITATAEAATTSLHTTAGYATTYKTFITTSTAATTKPE